MIILGGMVLGAALTLNWKCGNDQLKIQIVAKIKDDLRGLANIFITPLDNEAEFTKQKSFNGTKVQQTGEKKSNKWENIPPLDTKIKYTPLRATIRMNAIFYFRIFQKSNLYFEMPFILVTQSMNNTEQIDKRTQRAQQI